MLQHSKVGVNSRLPLQLTSPSYSQGSYKICYTDGGQDLYMKDVKRVRLMCLLDGLCQQTADTINY